MTEIERAYLTLGLKEGSSLRQVDEACKDLRALWNPDRLSDNPRLRAKAGEKIREIDAAYETLMEHLGQASTRRVSRPSPTKKEPPRDPAQQGEKPSASLFEEAFSDSIAEGRKRIPIWGILVAAILAIVLVSYLAFAPGQEEASSVEETEPVEEESELTKMVEEIRSRYSQGEEPAPDANTLPDPNADQVAASVTPPAPEARQDPQSPQASDVPKQAIADPPAPRVEKPSVKAEPIRKTQPEPPPKEETIEDTRQDKPKLVREEVAPDQPEEPQPGPSDEQMDIFKTLLNGSATASKLVKGEIATLSFTEWSVIQETPSETWVDVVAAWSSGQEVHFFWGVNPSTGAVRALNQAARNLESSMGGP